MPPIRLGVIGLSTKGWASRLLIPPIFDPLLSSHYKLTALCTTNPSSAQAASDKYSKLAGSAVKAYHGDSGAQQLIKDPEVDMVVISVRIPDHLKLALPAIEEGKDLFIEWSVGNGYKETKEIADAIERKRKEGKGIKCLVGAQAIQSLWSKKVKELVKEGKIGRVLSSTIILNGVQAETGMWGPTAYDGTRYVFDVKNGATPLTINTAHLLAVVTDIFGSFTSVTGDATIQIPTAEVLDANDKPTGETLTKTTPDQYGFTGTLADGTFLTAHVRSGIKLGGEQGKARRQFLWVIDGEEGSIEVQGLPEHGDRAYATTTLEKKVLLNGVEVPIEGSEIDKLGNTGKAWLEFAKGGRYTTIEDAVRLHRAVDAIERSIEEGKKITLN
ncbi:oxidoreductase [Panus rudis PR-1116 ss-1]|nr:oxidoreductase [Panus rudis PR-1116 ss-1]